MKYKKYQRSFLLALWVKGKLPYKTLRKFARNVEAGVSGEETKQITVWHMPETHPTQQYFDAGKLCSIRRTTRIFSLNFHVPVFRRVRIHTKITYCLHHVCLSTCTNTAPTGRISVKSGIKGTESRNLVNIIQKYWSLYTKT